MKFIRLLLILLALGGILLLGGCRRLSSAEPSEAVSEPSEAVSETRTADQLCEQHADFLENFFYLFSEPFSSTDQLPSETVLFFTLIELYDEQGDLAFAYDEALDAYLLPADLVREGVSRWFGLEGFDGSDSDRYQAEGDGFLYSTAHGFPIVYPRIASAQLDGDQLHLHVEYTNPEQDGNPVTGVLDFVFAVEEDSLRAVRAVEG